MSAAANGPPGQLRVGEHYILSSKSGQERVQLKRILPDGGAGDAPQCTVALWRVGQLCNANVPQHLLSAFTSSDAAQRSGRILRSVTGASEGTVPTRGLPPFAHARRRVLTCLPLSYAAGGTPWLRMPSAQAKHGIPARAFGEGNLARQSKRKTIARAREGDAQDHNDGGDGDQAVGASDDAQPDDPACISPRGAQARNEGEEEVVQRLKFDPRRSGAREVEASSKRRLPSPEPGHSECAKKLRSDGARDDGGKEAVDQTDGATDRSSLGDSLTHRINHSPSGKDDGAGHGADAITGARAQNAGVPKGNVGNVGGAPVPGKRGKRKKLSLTRGRTANERAEKGADARDSMSDDSPLIDSTTDEEGKVIDLTDDSKDKRAHAHVPSKAAPAPSASRNAGTGSAADSTSSGEISAQPVKLSDKHQKLVANILKRNKSEANLSGTWGSAGVLTRQDMRLMFDALRHMTATNLDLCKQQLLGDEGMRHLVNTVLKSPSCNLTRLDLNSTGLSNKAIPVLFEGLSHARSIDSRFVTD